MTAMPIPVVRAMLTLRKLEKMHGDRQLAAAQTSCSGTPLDKDNGKDMRDRSQQGLGVHPFLVQGYDQPVASLDMRYGNPSCLTSITNEQLVLNGTHSLKTARSMNSFTKLGRIEAACLYLENAHGVRKIPMGRTFYWKTCLWKANHKKHLCYGAVGT